MFAEGCRGEPIDVYFKRPANCGVEKQVKEAHRQSGGAVSIFSLIRLGSTAGSIRPRKQTNRGKVCGYYVHTSYRAVLT